MCTHINAQMPQVGAQLQLAAHAAQDIEYLALVQHDM